MGTRGHVDVNKKGHLEIAGCDVVDLARRYGTPLYVMDEDLIRQNCRRYVESMKRLCTDFGIAYAGKAFMSGWILNVVAEEGLYLDVVSGGELYTALKAGFPAERILFHGNNKSVEEITMGLKAGVGRFVVDSYLELENLDAIAQRLGVRADIMLRISPGVEAHTHNYIETGILDSKFGFPLQNGEALRAVKRALASKAVVLRGLHSHIGSQILETQGPVAASARMVEFISELKHELGVEIHELDLGGGLGVRYTSADRPPEIESFVEVLVKSVHEACERMGVKYPKLFLEPGRSIVGEAGITVYTAGAIKEIPGVRTYVCVDGGMTDNPRPALYGAVYEAVVANRASETPSTTVCIAGKCCESGDILIREAHLPPVRSGDLIAVLTTGAYNYSMASNYNRIPRPAVVAVSKGTSRLVVRRETYADLVAKDIFTTGARRLAAAAGSAQWEKTR